MVAFVFPTQLESIKTLRTDKVSSNIPKTAGGPGGHDRTLAVKSPKNAQKLTEKKIFLHISSSYAKILGETNFHTREIP